MHDLIGRLDGAAVEHRRRMSLLGDAARRIAELEHVLVEVLKQVAPSGLEPLDCAGGQQRHKAQSLANQFGLSFRFTGRVISPEA